MRILILFITCLFSAVAFGAERKPNIVFILADDLGYTDLACYGSKYYETPNLDRLAKNGMRFTDAHTCGPNCQPSRAALLSGQYGPRTGVYTVGGIDRFDWKSRPLRPVANVAQLPLEKTTIADALKKAGYVTGMFGKWHLGNDAEHHPSQRGFDEAIETSGVHFNFKTDPSVEYPDGQYLADFLTDKAVDFIQRHREKPFFLYVPHFGVHKPTQAKESITREFKNKQTHGGHNNPVYAAMIKSVDESVGRIVAELARLKLTENTLVIFSSDNGGVGGYEREGIKKEGDVTDNSPLRGGKGMFYEGGHRVPYIVSWPGQTPANQISTETIIGVDLFPTLLELTAAKAPTNQPLDGVSHLAVVRGKENKLKRDAVYWHFPGYLGAGVNQWRTTPVGAIRSGEWKLLEFFEDGRLELYDLSKDLGETNDVSKRFPEKTSALHQKLVAWRKQIDAPMPAKNSDPAPAAGSSKTGRKTKRDK